jgi:hypothetical protein
MLIGRFPRGVAYHEAGHAIAQIYVGAPATLTRIFMNGTGYSDSNLDSWESSNSGIGTVWDLLLVYMAGAHAEATATKRSLESVRLSAGLKDYVSASVLIIILSHKAAGLTEEAIWRQADKERLFFLHRCWPTIAKMAVRLQTTGSVSSAELRTLTKRYRKKFVTSLCRPA